MALKTTIKEDAVGQRLDKYVSNWLELSRSETWRLLEQNQISLNSKKINKSFKGYSLQLADLISVNEYKKAQDLIILANDKLPLNIIEDKPEYIAINKEAGQNIMPKSEIEDDTILNALIAKYPQIQGIGEAGLRSGVVHRLDKDTSGILIVAKTQSKWQSLRQAFKEHKSHKIYHAIVLGDIANSGQIEMNLRLASSKPAKVRLAKPNEKSWLCNLSWQKLESFEKASLVKIVLGTGFLHQIRVMMAELGHAVMADSVYGKASRLAPRQMLHAKSINIDGINLSADYSPDFSLTLEKLRES